MEKCYDHKGSWRNATTIEDHGEMLRPLGIMEKCYDHKGSWRHATTIRDHGEMLQI